MLRNKILSFLKNYYWLILFLLLFFAFTWKIFLKGYVIGPFDFMTNYYHPFREVFLGNDYLTNVAARFKNFLMSDVVSVVTPTQLLVNKIFRENYFPLWNPYLLSGSPLLANVQSAVLYPLNIIFFLFKPAEAYNLFILFQILLAFLFMFLYLRTLKLDKFPSYIGAIAFSFSSFFITWLPWGTRGHVFLWLPLNLYSIEKFIETKNKKFTILLLAGLTLSFYAGHTQTGLMVFFVTYSYIIWKTISGKKFYLLKWVLITALLNFVLIAPQLLPSVEMYRLSVRDILATISFYKDQTLYFSSYIQAIFPDYFGNPVTRNWWGKTNYAESNIYFGSLALYFASYALFNIRKQKNSILTFILTVSMLGIVLSTDNFISLLLFKLKFPLISSSTFSRYSLLFIFSGSILSAFGINYFMQDFYSKNTKKINLLNIIFLLLIAVAWTTVILKTLPKEYLVNLGVIKRNLIIPSLIITTTIISCYLLRLSVKNKKYSLFIFSLLIVLLTGIEYVRFAYKYTPFSPKEFFYPNHPVFTTLKKLTHDGRYYNFIPPNIAGLYNGATVDGSEPLYNERYGKLASMSDDGLPNPTDRAALQIPDGPYKSRVLNILSAKYFVDEADNIRDQKWAQNVKEIWTDGRIRIYQNLTALDRFNILYEVTYSNNEKQILSKLIDTNFDPKRTVVIEGGQKIALTGKGTYTIKQVSDQTVHQEYSVTTTKPAIFLLVDTYYPGWKAKVDGKQTEILKANYAFRAVFVPEGKHLIAFDYSPNSFRNGVLLFFTGLILILLYLIYGKKTSNTDR